MESGNGPDAPVAPSLCVRRRPGPRAVDLGRNPDASPPQGPPVVRAPSRTGLALFAGFEIAIRFLRAQIAIQILVQLQRLGGCRIVQSIVALEGLDDQSGYKTRAIFDLDEVAGSLRKISTQML